MGKSFVVVTVPQEFVHATQSSLLWISYCHLATRKKDFNILAETIQVFSKIRDGACVRIGKDGRNNDQDFIESAAKRRSTSLEGMYSLTTHLHELIRLESEIIAHTLIFSSIDAATSTMDCN